MFFKKKAAFEELENQAPSRSTASGQSMFARGLNPPTAQVDFGFHELMARPVSMPEPSRSEAPVEPATAEMFFQQEPAVTGYGAEAALSPPMLEPAPQPQTFDVQPAEPTFAPEPAFEQGAHDFTHDYSGDTGMMDEMAGEELLFEPAAELPPPVDALPHDVSSFYPEEYAQPQPDDGGLSAEDLWYGGTASEDVPGPAQAYSPDVQAMPDEIETPQEVEPFETVMPTAPSMGYAAEGPELEFDMTAELAAIEAYREPPVNITPPEPAAAEHPGAREAYNFEAMFTGQLDASRPGEAFENTAFFVESPEEAPGQRLDQTFDMFTSPSQVEDEAPVPEWAPEPPSGVEGPDLGQDWLSRLEPAGDDASSRWLEQVDQAEAGNQVPDHAGASAEFLDSVTDTLYPADPFAGDVAMGVDQMAAGEQAFEEAAQFLFPETTNAPLEWGGDDDFSAPSPPGEPLQELGPSFQADAGEFDDLTASYRSVQELEPITPPSISTPEAEEFRMPAEPESGRERSPFGGMLESAQPDEGMAIQAAAMEPVGVEAPEAPLDWYGEPMTDAVTAAGEPPPADEAMEASGLRILARAALPGDKQLLVIQSDGERDFALMGHAGTSENPHISVLKRFDHNPLQYQNTFTAVAETRPDEPAGRYVVQIGNWHGIVSVFQDNIQLQSELG